MDGIEEIRPSLAAMGLADGPCTITTLAGGVSCDVFLVESATGCFCVKRALPKLRVAAEWRAPAERSHAEVAWMKLVGGIDPNLVPAILGEDRPRHIFAMEYFPPDIYPVWKSRLAAGEGDAVFAAKVGSALARIHAETAGRDDIARAFANGVQFHALRVDVYLLHTAAKHADVAPLIRAMAKNLGQARIALMQGDISPKNILVGPEGPVFLDAETCCYGDPAFDLAFCLNHLLLKGVWHPEHAQGYGECFAALSNAYFEGANWEPRPDLEHRTAGLLSALLLARIDGKSPVEYITAEPGREFVRITAKRFLAERINRLGTLLARWTDALADRQM
jgi:aminoglycoside phosphotransferase (APT) family kinase protein